jgi:hypothetical protein
MRNELDSRFALLNALIEYGERSGTFNPHFHKKEMMEKLGISEGEFNIVQKSLGNKYCHIVDIHEGNARYAISMDECYRLRDELRQQRILGRRHRQILWATIIAIIVTLVAIIGPLLWRYR